MRTICLLFVFIVVSCCKITAQEAAGKTAKILPQSIYFTASENSYTEFYSELQKQVSSLQFKFLKFDTDRLNSNLSNTLYFDAFTAKPSRYYMDTYKKLYDLKGQEASFFNIEKLYELPLQRRVPDRNK